MDCHFLLQGLPNPEIEPTSPAWQACSLPLSHLGNPSLILPMKSQGSLGGSAGKDSTCNAGDLGSIPGFGRFHGEGNSYPLQYSGLENSMDCIAHGVARSQTQLNDFHCHEIPSIRNVSSRMEHPLTLHLPMTTAPQNFLTHLAHITAQERTEKEE